MTESLPTPEEMPEPAAAPLADVVADASNGNAAKPTTIALRLTHILSSHDLSGIARTIERMISSHRR